MIVDEVEVKTHSIFNNYAVSRDGRIWSKPRKNRHGELYGGRWLKPTNRHGYLFVELYNGAYSRILAVHRLVLETYVGPCPEGMETCHNNSIKIDNRLENLRWDTKRNNQLDAIERGTASCLHQNGENNPVCRLTEEQVRLLFNAYHDGAYTQQELADYFRINRATVGQIVRKETWRHLWTESRII